MMRKFFNAHSKGILIFSGILLYFAILSGISHIIAGQHQSFPGDLVLIGLCAVLVVLAYLSSRKKTEKKKEIAPKMSLRNRLITVSIPSLLLAVTIGLCAPLQMYLTNITELWFTIGDIWWMCVLCSLAIFALCCLIGVLLPERAMYIFVCLLVGLSLGLYLQGNYINANYGVLDGRDIDWGSYHTVAVVNTVIWIACLAVPILLFCFKRTLAEKVLPIIAVCLIAMQILSVGILFAVTPLNKFSSADHYLSVDGLNDVSEDENVVIFVLDTYDIDVLEKIIADSPEFLSPLDGFTCFTNATSMYPTTKGSLPYILTRTEYRNEIPYNEHVKKAYREIDYYRTLKEHGYDIGLFTTGLFVSDDNEEPLFVNYCRDKMMVSSYSGLAKSLYRFSAFRYFPHLLKPLVWFYSGDFDQWKTVSGAKGGATFTGNDLVYYRYLKENELSVESGRKNYKLIHLDGVHLPFTLTEDLEEKTDGITDAVSEGKASLKIVYEYIRQLKERGLYDKTTFIVTADHGFSNGLSSPILLVKGRGMTGPLAFSNAPVCHGDLMGTIMSDIGLNEKGKYGESVYDIQEGDTRERRFLYYSWDDAWSSDYLPIMTEYRVDPSGNDASSFIVANYEPRKYTLGTELSFRSGTANYYGIEGLSLCETTHTWTNGKKAVFSFSLDHIPQNDLILKLEVILTYHGPQRVIVSYNAEQLYSKTVNGADYLTIVIPQKMIADPNLEIEFELPDAISGSEIGDGDETRRLALALGSMVLEEMDEKAEDSLQEQNGRGYTYEIGQEIFLTTDGRGERYFTSGLSGPEGDFTWSLGKQGQIQLDIGEWTEDLVGEICLRGLYGDSQRLVIQCGDQTLLEETVTSVAEPIRFAVPASCIKDGLLTLDFQYPDAVSPASQGESSDTRELALLYHSIRFDKGDTSHD